MSLFKDYTVGIDTLIEWFGRACATVDNDVAEKRAETCAPCPNNKMVGWQLTFGRYAQVIMGIRAWLRHKGKITKLDGQLGVCDVCSCPMRVKVWVPIDVIRNNMDADTVKKLHPKCWITK